MNPLATGIARNHGRFASNRTTAGLLLAAPLLTACYVVPVQPEGRVYPPAVFNSGTSAGTFPTPVNMSSYPLPIAAVPGPVVLTARL